MLPIASSEQAIIPGVFQQEVKQCTSCKKILPLTAFHLNIKRGKLTRRAICCKCGNLQSSKYHYNNKGNIQYTLRRLCTDAKKRAKKQGVPFALTPEYLESLVVSHCPITLAPIDWEKKEVVNGNAGPNSASLDKIIPELGYVPGNCAIISYRGNTIKNNGTIDEHRRIIKYMAEQQLKHIDF